eukprot:Seg1430.15 transcript_id=Seg1430.15/GoldUCD/mRNA.D3Y31 product="hypothetical protein" protein_id=Seg1430.15/GoldUCD/D3Y31
MACCAPILRWRRRKKEERYIKKLLHEEEELKQIYEAYRETGRRTAICEKDLKDRGDLLAQLEKYIRWQKLNDYGIIRCNDMKDIARTGKPEEFSNVNNISESPIVSFKVENDCIQD